MAKTPERDPWRHLAAATPARIALGRAGGSLPTEEVLRFALAHAQARDAVHAAFDAAALAAALRAAGLAVVEVESRAVDRAAYLRRPDWGRELSGPSEAALDGLAPGGDLVIVVGDGLSATAVAAHAVPLIAALRPHLAAAGIACGAAVIARGARVALGDAIAARLGAKAVLMLIGERPGLSSPDSLGAYLTFAPKPGRTDAERNCVSNIRPGGLPPAAAAFKLGWLAAEAFRRKLTGVALKDESDLIANGRGEAALPPRS
jgi:ethanolamine ammonia-lyase small subunit